jgi:hypothetical protein
MAGSGPSIQTLEIICGQGPPADEFMAQAWSG